MQSAQVNVERRPIEQDAARVRHKEGVGAMTSEAQQPNIEEILVLRIYDGESEVDVQAFNKPNIVLGRDPFADVCIKDPLVSRVHATIQRTGGALVCQDHSSN